MTYQVGDTVFYYKARAIVTAVLSDNRYQLRLQSGDIVCARDEELRLL